MKKSYIIFDFLGTLVQMRPPSLYISKNILLSLSRNYQLGIITNGKRAEVINILTKLGVIDLFETVITKDDTSLRKPDPMLFSQFNGQIVVYVGDTLKDYRMAKSANIPFIYIGRMKIGVSQLNFKRELVEEAINKLLSSGELI